MADVMDDDSSGLTAGVLNRMTVLVDTEEMSSTPDITVVCIPTSEDRLSPSIDVVASIASDGTMGEVISDDGVGPPMLSSRTVELISASDLATVVMLCVNNGTVVLLPDSTGDNLVMKDVSSKDTLVSNGVVEFGTC